MAELTGEVQATRVALLELGDERRLVQEGHELLDEKRVMLAGEILRRLREHAAAQARVAALDVAARAAFLAAVARHGWEGLALSTPASFAGATLRTTSSGFLGIGLLAMVGTLPPEPALDSALLPDPELRGCAVAFQRQALAQLELAAASASLRRLAQEYRRTERRARALENVVLPEIDAALQFVAEQLEALDLEEAVRVRSAAARRAG